MMASAEITPFISYIGVGSLMMRMLEPVVKT